MTFISADLEMAIAYWNIVLKDRFRFLEIWCQFLQVSWIYLCFWGEGGYMEHVHTGKSRGTLLVSPGIKKIAYNYSETSNNGLSERRTTSV